MTENSSIADELVWMVGRVHTAEISTNILIAPHVLDDDPYIDPGTVDVLTFSEKALFHLQEHGELDNYHLRYACHWLEEAELVLGAHHG